jgi:preprotein translocase subunit SecG
MSGLCGSTEKRKKAKGLYMIYWVIIGFHIIVSVTLIVIVLLQTGKGVGLSGVFGAGGAASESFFGGRGAGDFLTKATTAAAIIFMVTCLLLAKISAIDRGESVMEKTTTEEKAEKTRKGPKKPIKEALPETPAEAPEETPAEVPTETPVGTE